MIPIQLLTCPLCARELQQVGSLLRCPQRHTFDIAGEGYVNLLRKQQTGDTREMLRARRSFLEQGYYQPLSEHINNMLIEHLPTTDAAGLHMLDAGCGEGYYLGRLLQALSQHYPSLTAVGIDISKEAVRMAAKRYREAFFAVASIKDRFIFRDVAFHFLLNIFAPRNSAEFARVLLTSGLLMVVIPGEAHLARLRSTLELLNIEQQKQQH
ncbi:MAG: methyltransferase domain-containing protein, partial [Ktedonobacteraceae bacterium]|nr:methyltransferase domain-containing protein [Ktedonobacteraceae bacterium]